MLLTQLVASKAWRRVWSIGGTVTCVEDRNGVMWRPREEWGSRADLLRACAWWLPRRLKAASPAGLIFQVAREWYRKTNWTKHGFAKAFVRGGWQETAVRGVIRGPHKMYDLRRAYRWALTSQPLPARESIHVARRYAPELPGVHVCSLEPWKGAPYPLCRGGTQLVETPQDETLYGRAPIRSWHGGITWHRWIHAQPLGDLLDALDVAACQRAYWGLWAAQAPVRCDFASGKVTELQPYGTDYVRAHLITHRVRRRLAEVETDYRYVDAVIVADDRAPRTGPNVGDWAVKHEYPDGLWIAHPGKYGPLEASA